MFATSWLLTFFSHDIENFQNLQRLFDVFIAQEPDSMLISVIEATIQRSKGSLQDYVQEPSDLSVAPFMVLKTPLRMLNSPEVIEYIVS